MNRIEKYNVIKQVIDDWDPVGLHAMNCHTDEYALEITKISSEIEKLKTKEKLGLHIHNVFKEMFDNTDTKALNVENCNEVAQLIINNINN